MSSHKRQIIGRKLASTLQLTSKDTCMSSDRLVRLKSILMNNIHIECSQYIEVVSQVPYLTNKPQKKREEK